MLRILKMFIVGLMMVEMTFAGPVMANEPLSGNLGKKASARPVLGAWALSSGVEQDAGPIHFTDIVCPSVTTCYISAIDRVLKTTDSGKTFNTVFRASQEEVKSPKTKSVLWFSDPLTGFAAIAGGNYIGVRTKDGGRTWTELKSSAFAGHFGFYDDKHGISGTTSGLMFSEDGGTTWNEAAVEKVEDPRRFYSKPAVMHHKDYAPVGFIVAFDTDSGKSLLLKTEDMGKTWKGTAPEGYQGLRSVYFIDRDHGWLGTDKGIIFKTSDAGQTWKETVVSSVEIRQITCTGKLTCFALSGVMLYRTNDGGTTWTMLQPFDITKPVYPEAIGFTTSDFGIVAGFYSDLKASKEINYIAYTTTGGILKQEKK